VQLINHLRVSTAESNNCYRDCICAVEAQVLKCAKVEVASLADKASDSAKFEQQLEAYLEWLLDATAPTLPQWVQDHVKQTQCGVDACPE
jgi:hypothetical protein